MKEILCTYGGIALVDDEDYHKVCNLNWNDYAGYPRTFKRVNGGKLTSETMHRIILIPKEGFVIDHINGNKLDNRKENLRYCLHCENTRNSKINSRNKTGYKGVIWHKRDKKFQANIRINGKRIHLGYFIKAEDAARAYNAAAIKYHKEFARLNIIKD